MVYVVTGDPEGRSVKLMESRKVVDAEEPELGLWNRSRSRDDLPVDVSAQPMLVDVVLRELFVHPVGLAVSRRHAEVSELVEEVGRR